MPGTVVPTPNLESVLEEVDHPLAVHAISEFKRLKDSHMQLATHFMAVKRQTDSTGACLRALLLRPDGTQPEAATHLTGRLLE